MTPAIWIAVCLLGLPRVAGYSCDDVKHKYQDAGCCEDANASVDCITQADIEAHQQAWGAALVAIGNAWNGSDCAAAKSVALGGIPLLYDLSYNPLFKPTYTTAPNTFRPTLGGALSYFVGACADEAHIAGDGGFALGAAPGLPQTSWKGWTSATFSGFSYLVGGAFCDAAIAQGHGTFVAGYDGAVAQVDKTFAYVKNRANDGGPPVKLVVHHSSEVVSAP